MHFLKKLGSLPTYSKAEDVPMSTVQEGLDLYKQAADLGMTFWQFLETIQPSKAGDSLTAFERQLRLAGVIPKSIPELGLFSSSAEYLFQSDRPGSAILFPTLLQKEALWTKARQYTDINAIVATTRTISGTSSYQALHIDDSEIYGTGANGRRFRVDQAGNFPRVKIAWSDVANSVAKHGVQLDWSYEFVRRASIELLTTIVSRIMLQDAISVFDDAVAFAINGDGSTANPAATVKTFCKSTKATPGANEIVLDVSNDSIAAGVLPYEGWLKFIGGFTPYTPNVVCGNLATLVKFVTMSRPTMDPAAVITALLESKNQGTAKLNNELFPNVTLYLADGVPNNKLVAIDKDFALERVIELGSDIKEVTKVIQQQTEAMVISIADNVSKVFPAAIRVLDFSSAPAS